MNFPIPTITPYQTVSSGTQPSSQDISARIVNQMQNGGILLLLLVIGCFCLRRWYQKQCKQQVASQHHYEQQAMDQHRQHIESLEQIWRMQSYQKPESDSRHG